MKHDPQIVGSLVALFLIFCFVAALDVRDRWRTK